MVNTGYIFSPVSIRYRVEKCFNQAVKPIFKTNKTRQVIFYGLIDQHKHKKIKVAESKTEHMDGLVDP